MKAFLDFVFIGSFECMEENFDLEQHRAYTYHFYFHDGLFAYIQHIRDFIDKIDNFLVSEGAQKKAEETSETFDPYFSAEIQFEGVFPDILWRTTFLHSYFFLESSLNQICKNIQLAEGLASSLQDMKGTGINRASNYMKKVVGVSKTFETTNWQRIQELNVIRNIFVHAEGYVPLENIKVDNFIKNHPGMEVFESEFEKGLKLISISKIFTSHAIDLIDDFFSQLVIDIKSS